MVYQEQVMRIINRLGNIPLSNAYSCIKAISKKKEKDIVKYESQFLEGAVENGLTKNQAAELFEMIKKFAGYGFNKSHSTAYALIAYMTAYLKAHFPVEFMAALLSGDIQGRNFKTKDQLVEHLEDCRRMDIEVVSPDINTSCEDFTVHDGKIYFGLSAIKGCGGSAAGAIVDARKQGGPYKDLFDFCERVDPSRCNRAAIETLIKAGAFDSMGAKRSQTSAAVERALQAGAALHSDRKSGQKGLFDSFDEEEQATTAKASMPDMPEWEEKVKLAAEKEVLGFYLSSHPLAEYEKTLSTYCSHTLDKVASLQARTEVMVGGSLTAIKFSQTKNPRPDKPSKYVMFDLEDMTGIVRCILWPDDFVNHGHMVAADAILVVKGVIDRRGEEANLIVNELIPLEDLAGRFTRGMVVRVTEEQHAQRGLEDLYEILRGYPGSCELQLVVCLADGAKAYLKSGSLRIDLNPELRNRVDQLLGPGNVKLLSAPHKPMIQAGNGRRPMAKR
jgi:DNA polymerase-3 subunit alpha